jgi:hypothetical protein
MLRLCECFSMRVQIHDDLGKIPMVADGRRLTKQRQIGTQQW